LFIDFIVNFNFFRKSELLIHTPIIYRGELVSPAT
jgi:hypothetical protein